MIKCQPLLFGVHSWFCNKGSIFSCCGVGVILAMNLSSDTSTSTSSSIYSLVSSPHTHPWQQLPLVLTSAIIEYWLLWEGLVRVMCFERPAWNMFKYMSNYLLPWIFFPLLAGLDRVWYGKNFLNSVFKIIDILLLWHCIYYTSLLNVIKWFGHNTIIVLNFLVMILPWIFFFRDFVFSIFGFSLFMWLCKKISL